MKPDSGLGLHNPRPVAEEGSAQHRRRQRTTPKPPVQSSSSFAASLS